MPAPIFDPSRGFRFWNKSEIYSGPTGTGRFVPNVDDAVWDWSQGLSRVVDVDLTTGLSTLIAHNFAMSTGGVLDEDVLLGSAPGTPSESFRLYVNTAVLPHVAACDARLHIYGTQAHHVKIFRGTDTTVNGHVISAMFNTSGVMISENIPLELVTMPGINNVAVKTIAVGGVIETVQDGDVVTVVVYSQAGAVLSRYKLLVQNTDFIRTTDASKKYILGIDLVSPYLSTSDSHLLEYPINMLVQSGSLQGRVRYSDGSQLLLPIDGSRFQLHGIDNYVASVLGQRVPLVLTYNLAPDEYAYGVGGPLPDRFLTEEYTLTTVEAQGAYTVKLFVVPTWTTTPTARWKLEYYLYNLDRDEIFYVTPYVQMGPLSPSFNGNAIGVRQELTVTMNLNQLGASYNYYQHVQTFAITLLALGSSTNAPQYHHLEYTPGNEVGVNLKAVATPSATVGQWKLDVGNGIASSAAWLAAVYAPAEALVYVPVEPSAPTPTHFRLRIGNSWSREVLVTDYATLIDNITVTPVNGEAARLEFFRRQGPVDMELAVVALAIQKP